MKTANTPVEVACLDLKRHSLDRVCGDFSRLIYLTSTRDYATGQYHHDGLAFRCGADVTSQALAICHREVFLTLALGSLEQLVRNLELFIHSTGIQPGQIIQIWKQLQPFRVAVPLDCDRILAEKFISDVKVALAILESRVQA